MVTLAEGVSAYLEGRWLDALGACDRAEAVFRDACTGVAWELDTAHAYALWALSHLGRWAELSRRCPRADQRGPRARRPVRGDEPEHVHPLDRPPRRRRPRGRPRGDAPGDRRSGRRQGYHVQHNDLVWASVQIDLYCGDGDAAWERITGHWPTLTRSLLLRVQFIRVAMLGLRARCGLACGAAAALRSAARDADRLERERLPWADAQARMVRAAPGRPSRPPRRGGRSPPRRRLPLPRVRHGLLGGGGRPPPRPAPRRPRRGRASWKGPTPGCRPSPSAAPTAWPTSTRRDSRRADRLIEAVGAGVESAILSM